MLAQKGGSGKTTLAVHLAVEATVSGLRVLLVDIDPQASSTMWWRRRAAPAPELVQERGAGIAKLLTQARRSGYDLVVIDTAPHSSEESAICARLCDMVCVPSRPAILDLDAIGTSTEILAQAGTNATIVLNACPPPSRRGESRIVAEARQALEVYRVPVCEATVSQRATLAHALIDGRVARELEPGGKAAAEVARLWETLSGALGR